MHNLLVRRPQDDVGLVLVVVRHGGVGFFAAKPLVRAGRHMHHGHNGRPPREDVRAIHVVVGLGGVRLCRTTPPHKESAGHVIDSPRAAQDGQEGGTVPSHTCTAPKWVSLTLSGSDSLLKISKFDERTIFGLNRDGSCSQEIKSSVLARFSHLRKVL